jgi:polar amino acid transport system substrate-binding protein
MVLFDQRMEQLVKSGELNPSSNAGKQPHLFDEN